MNKLAIITGASTGIGFELASIAAKEGYDIIIVADEDLIHAAAADIAPPTSLMNENDAALWGLVIQSALGPHADH